VDSWTVKPSVLASFYRMPGFVLGLNKHGWLGGASVMMQVFGPQYAKLEASR